MVGKTTELDKLHGSNQINILYYANILIKFATIVGICSILIRIFVDSDTWWHVAIGNDILSSLTIPSIDHYATAAWGRPYHDSHWIFQIILALADRLGGDKAVDSIMVIIWGAALFCCYRSMRVWLSTACSCFLIFFIAIACNDRFLPRPEIITYFMVAIFYLLLQQKIYRKPFQLGLFAVLQIIWSNSHGLFVIGPAMIACSFIGEMLARYPDSTKERREHIKLFITVVAASLITPYGFEGWQYAFLLLREVGSGSPAIFKNLLELAPTFGQTSRSYPDFWIYLSLSIIVTVSIIYAILHKKISYSRLLIVALLFGLSLTGRRNIPLFALVAGPFIAENTLMSMKREFLPSSIIMILAVMMLLFSYFTVSGRYYRMFKYPLYFGIGTSPEAYSSQLPIFLRQINFKGQIYNPSYLGGYCLYNGIIPLFDGRWEVYDQETLDAIFNAPYDQSAWGQLVEKYDIRGVVLSYGEFDTDLHLQRLRDDGRFSMIFSDKASSFWIRTRVLR
jgi:hypothetical protein